MFGDLLGNIQQQQEAMQQKLADITVQAEAGDGAVTVTASGDLQIQNITLDPTRVDLNDREALEDLLIVAVNRALAAAKAEAATETNKLLQQMMPGGLGSLLGR